MSKTAHLEPSRNLVFWCGSHCCSFFPYLSRDAVSYHKITHKQIANLKILKFELCFFAYQSHVIQYFDNSFIEWIMSRSQPSFLPIFLIHATLDTGFTRVWVYLLALQKVNRLPPCFLHTKGYMSRAWKKNFTVEGSDTVDASSVLEKPTKPGWC